MLFYKDEKPLIKKYFLLSSSSSLIHNNHQDSQRKTEILLSHIYSIQNRYTYLHEYIWMILNSLWRQSTPQVCCYASEGVSLGMRLFAYTPRLVRYRVYIFCIHMRKGCKTVRKDIIILKRVFMRDSDGSGIRERNDKENKINKITM